MVNVKQHKVFPTIINEIQFDMDEQEHNLVIDELNDEVDVDEHTKVENLLNKLTQLR